MSARVVSALAIACCALAQQAQNPSPMVEHTREHRRLPEQHPEGRREKLELGTLYLPAGRPKAIVFFFHGGTWLPEVAAAQNRVAVVSVQAGAGSATYSRLFDDDHRFERLLDEAESKAGVRFDSVIVGGWSAGCGAVRRILSTPSLYPRIKAAILIDGIHTGYANGKPGPLESAIETDNLRIWEQLGRDAMARRKTVLITHSEIFPGTFASTTETADYLLKQLAVTRRAVLKWGPMGLQQLSEATSGNFELRGYAGNSAPDHVDQLHALPLLLKEVLHRR